MSEPERTRICSTGVLGFGGFFFQYYVAGTQQTMGVILGEVRSIVFSSWLNTAIMWEFLKIPMGISLKANNMELLPVYRIHLVTVCYYYY